MDLATGGLLALAVLLFGSVFYFTYNAASHLYGLILELRGLDPDGNHPGRRVASGLITVVLLVLGLGASSYFMGGEDQMAMRYEEIASPGDSSGLVGDDRVTSPSGETISTVLAGLPVRRVDWNEIESMQYGQPNEIRLVVGSPDEVSARQDMLGIAGIRQNGEFRIAPRVAARLVSYDDKVLVAPMGEQVRAVLPNQSTVISWQVTPKTLDAFRLRLELENHLILDGQSYPVMQPVFVREFDVNASAWDVAADWLEASQGFWALIGGLAVVGSLGGFVWRRRSASASDT